MAATTALVTSSWNSVGGLELNVALATAGAVVFVATVAGLRRTQSVPVEGAWLTSVAQRVRQRLRRHPQPEQQLAHRIHRRRRRQPRVEAVQVDLQLAVRESLDEPLPHGRSCQRPPVPDTPEDETKAEEQGKPCRRILGCWTMNG